MLAKDWAAQVSWHVETRDGRASLTALVSFLTEKMLQLGWCTKLSVSLHGCGRRAYSSAGEARARTHAILEQTFAIHRICE